MAYQLLTIPCVCHHLTTDAVLKVCIPLGIEGIGASFDLDVADNCGIAGFYQRHQLAVFVLGAKDPVPVTDGHEVLLGDPFGSLVGIASFRPPP